MPGTCTGGLFFRRRLGSGPFGKLSRWHAIWLLAQGWTASGTAQALGRDPHTIGRWAAAFGEGGPAALIFEQSGGPPPPALGETQQAELKATVQELPAMAGIELANWNWKAIHQFVSERFGISLSHSGCLNYLHRLGFAFKRPKKRLLKANEAKREAFAAEYAALWDEAGRTGGKIFFADEAHFRADAESRGKWVLKGEPAPRFHGAGSGGLQQSQVRREGQLLLGGVSGDRRGGVDGTGGEQQRRNIGDLPEATEGEAPWAIERHLGQRAGAPWRGVEGVPADAMPGAAAGEPAGLRPGLQRG